MTFHGCEAIATKAEEKVPRATNEARAVDLARARVRQTNLDSRQ